MNQIVVKLKKKHFHGNIIDKAVTTNREDIN